MSTTVKEAVRTAKALNEFVSVIKDAGITIGEMAELSMLKPAFAETIEKIGDWAVAPTTVKTISHTDKKRNYNMLSESTRHEIANYVANNCDGVVVDAVIAACQGWFHGIPPKTIKRIVSKETFVSLTDEYYTIDDGVIHKKK